MVTAGFCDSAGNGVAVHAATTSVAVNVPGKKGTSSPGGIEPTEEEGHS